MAVYTVLDKQEIEQILGQYGIEQIISFKGLSAGAENTNYAVSTNKGKYVLTLFEQKTPEKVIELAQLLEYLGRHELRTSKVVRTREQAVISFWKQKPILLKPFVEGKTVIDLPFHLLELIGQELAKLHQIDAPNYLPTMPSYGEKYFKEVKKYAANSDFDKWLEEILVYLRPYLTADLPKALIHSDLFADNVIISEDEKIATIVDFEEAVYYYRLFDIGMTIIGTCAEGKTIRLDKARHLLKGYQQITPLLEEEKEALQAFTVYAAAAMTFWRHQNFNYLNPTPALKEHYLGLKVLADYMKAQPANCFL